MRALLSRKLSSLERAWQKHLRLYPSVLHGHPLINSLSCHHYLERQEGEQSCEQRRRRWSGQGKLRLSESALDRFLRKTPLWHSNLLGIEVRLSDLSKVLPRQSSSRKRSDEVLHDEGRGTDPRICITKISIHALQYFD